MKGKIDGAHEPLADSKSKRTPSFDPNPASPATALDYMLNDGQGSLLSNLLPLKMNYSPLAHGATEALGSVPAQCDKSFETDSEGDDIETDCAESIRYSFQTKNIDSASPALKLTGLDFTALGEGKIDRSNVPMGTSSSLDDKKDDEADALTGAPSCGKISMSEKYCQCSFCLKELKKSKKLARYLEERSCSNNLNIKATQNRTKRSAELEFELNQQWRSLFLHTENVLAHDTAQLHTSFLKLKELREQCKRDLEVISLVREEK